MLVLVLNYMRVRQFLDSIKVPYFDIDANRLVNGYVLLESKATSSVSSSSLTFKPLQTSRKMNATNDSKQIDIKPPVKICKQNYIQKPNQFPSTQNCPIFNFNCIFLFTKECVNPIAKQMIFTVITDYRQKVLITHASTHTDTCNVLQLLFSWYSCFFLVWFRLN